MIGGMDIHLQTGRRRSRPGCSPAICDHWPTLSTRTATPAIFTNNSRKSLLPNWTKSSSIAMGPQRRGMKKKRAVPALYNTMIHVLGDEDMITLVVDEKDERMQEMIATSVRARRRNPLLARIAGGSMSTAHISALEETIGRSGKDGSSNGSCRRTEPSIISAQPSIRSPASPRAAWR